MSPNAMVDPAVGTRLRAVAWPLAPASGRRRAHAGRRGAGSLLALLLLLAGGLPAVAQTPSPGVAGAAGAVGPADCAAHAAAFDAPDGTPVIALVVDGLSLGPETDQPGENADGSADGSAEETASPPPPDGLAERFLALAPPIAFTVDPRAPGAAAFIGAIRAAGHEALLRLPIAPTRHDPRPSARREPDRPARRDGAPMLHSALTPEENLARMEQSMTAVSGYVGVYAGAGAPITANAALMKPLLLSLKRENCLLIDGRGSNRSIVALLAKRLEAASAPVSDRIAPGAERGSAYATLERIANGVGPGQGAILLAHAELSTLAAIEGWLGRRTTTGTRIAPVSVAARRPRPIRW